MEDEAEAANENGGPDISPLFAMLGGQNPKPDTAQGVADLLSQVRDHVEDHAFTRIGTLHTPDGSVVPTMLNPNGSYEFVPLSKIEGYMENPSFRRGTAVLTSLTSFIDHLNRFGDEDSAVFARDSRQNPGLLAVLDYHRKDTLSSGGEDETEGTREHGEYRHGLHRAVFDFPVSDEWKAWTGRNGTQMSMTEFAHFLEDNVLDVAEMGDAIPEQYERFVEMCGGVKNIADWSMLTKLAKSLSVFESAVVTEVTDLHGGAVNLTITEGHETEVEGIKATVPTMFFIAIPIFREGVFYRLPIRLRYRKGRGGISFWYEMWREDRAFMDAVRDAVNRVGSETEAQTFYGTPEA